MVENWPSGRSFPLVLTGGPLRAWPTTLLARSRLAGVLAGRLAVAGAVGGPLLGVDPLDGRTDPLSVGPLSRVARLGAERPVRIRDLVDAPVLLELGGGLAPGSPGPSRPRHGAERLEDIAGAVLLDG
jgi:hypothetical protein